MHILERIIHRTRRYVVFKLGINIFFLYRNTLYSHLKTQFLFAFFFCQAA